MPSYLPTLLFLHSQKLTGALDECERNVTANDTAVPTPTYVIVVEWWLVLVPLAISYRQREPQTTTPRFLYMT